jgi:hypothetical protein
MENDRPTPPEGYTLMLGKDVPNPVPYRTMAWDDSRYEWFNSIFVGAVVEWADHVTWYAVPTPTPTPANTEKPPISPWGYADAVPVSDLPDPVPEGTRYWCDIFGGWVDARKRDTSWVAVPHWPHAAPPIDPSFAKTLHSDPSEELDTDALEEALSAFRQTTDDMKTEKPTPSISEEASAIVAGDRADDYGDVNESFARIAKLWSAYTGTTVSPWDVAQMMILLKVSRAKTSTKRDTLVDIAGYAECAGQLKQAD